MLSLLMRHLKRWGAMALLASYAFVVLAPACDFAFGRDVSIVHALSEAHGGVLFLHVHHNRAGHAHGPMQPADGGDHCCGVFALPGLPPPYGVHVTDLAAPALIAFVPQEIGRSCNPPRPDRPPRLGPLI